MEQLPEIYTIAFDDDSGMPAFIIETSTLCFNSLLHPKSNEVQKTRFNKFAKGYLGVASRYDEDKNGKFGFGRCATYETTDEITIIRINLRGHTYADRVACTIHVILNLLNQAMHKEHGALSNRLQLMELDTVCSRSQKGHGIWGHLNPIMFKWCQQQSRRDVDYVEIDDVNKAMQTAFKTVAPRGIHNYYEDNGCGISRDGRPVFGCWGFGVCSNVNPENVSYADQMPMRISSDNVDAAYQGITLMAGWAKLFGLAHKELYGK